MKTEIELKAAAFDSFMDAADSVKIEAPNWYLMKSAALTLMACYAAERHFDEKSKSYDDKTEYFGEDYE